MEIYVIMQNAFQYSDYCQKCFESYFVEDACINRVKELNKKLQEFKTKYYSDRFDVSKKDIDDLTFFNMIKPFWEEYELRVYDVCMLNDFFYEKVELVDSYVNI